jgi:hypothetical protein
VSLLTIAGIPFPVLGSTKPADVSREIGSTSEAQSGAMRKSRRAMKGDFPSIESPAMATATAYAWEALVHGIGEAWSFDGSLYGSAGTGPSSSTGCTCDTTHVKFGAKALKVASGGAFVVPCPSVWTVIFWYWNGSAFVYDVGSSNGHGWYNGARNDSIAVYFATLISAGSLTVPDGGGVNSWYDDLVVLPYVAPDAWPPLWYASGVAFSPLPKLLVTGDLVPEGTRTMYGDCTPSALKAATVRRTLSVSLKEA